MEKSVIPTKPIADIVRDKDDESLERIDGWSTFTSMQKKVLQVIPWFSTLEDACTYLECSAHSMRRRISQNKKLRAAFDSRKDMRVDMAREMGADMLGIALNGLQVILTDPRTRAQARLAAIKLVFELNNVVKGPQAAGVTNTLVQAENVVMYDGARSVNDND